MDTPKISLSFDAPPASIFFGVIGPLGAFTTVNPTTFVDCSTLEVELSIVLITIREVSIKWSPILNIQNYSKINYLISLSFEKGLLYHETPTKELSFFFLGEAFLLEMSVVKLIGNFLYSSVFALYRIYPKY